ncbi:hypothetical protein KC19_10G054000 [Ceratodon purpureus]|uniref:Uncharacterized protein n=1 Tax=Ceratodon purpureus TaxID=3225 RepID=A0A8T0GHF5_CERPU|nr:hypothetical protein KC19_10G054000 [Ceratodon purpureus]
MIEVGERRRGANPMSSAPGSFGQPIIITLQTHTSHSLFSPLQTPSLSFCLEYLLSCGCVVKVGSIAECTTPGRFGVPDMVSSSFPVAYMELNLSLPSNRSCGMHGPWDSTPKRRLIFSRVCRDCVVFLFRFRVAR